MNHSIATGSAASVEIAQLVEALGSRDPTVRTQAREALGAAGHDAVIPLIEQLKSPVNQICWEAAKSLGAIKDPASANALAETLEHDNSDVRRVAAEALIALGIEGLKQTLIALLTNSGSVAMLEGARCVVSYFAHCKSGEWLRPLLTRFQAFEPAVAIPPAALSALHELERRVGVPLKMAVTTPWLPR